MTKRRLDHVQIVKDISQMIADGMTYPQIETELTSKGKKFCVKAYMCRRGLKLGQRHGPHPNTQIRIDALTAIENGASNLRKLARCNNYSVAWAQRLVKELRKLGLVDCSGRGKAYKHWVTRKWTTDAREHKQ